MIKSFRETECFADRSWTDVAPLFSHFIDRIYIGYGATNLFRHEGKFWFTAIDQGEAGGELVRLEPSHK